jgi:hypothetical protein
MFSVAFACGGRSIVLARRHRAVWRRHGCAALSLAGNAWFALASSRHRYSRKHQDIAPGTICAYIASLA